MKRNYNRMLLLAALLSGVFSIYLMSSGTKRVGYSYSYLIQNIEDQKISKVHISGYHLTGVTKQGIEFESHIPYQDIGIINRLLQNNVEILAQPPNNTPGISDILIALLPTILFIGALLFLNQGQWRKKITTSKQNISNVGFDSIAGLHAAKAEMLEIVGFLKNKEKYHEMGVKIPKGVLLIGPPGNGKTHLAKAVAKEAEVQFFYMAGSSFVEMYVGVGASRIRRLFAQAAASAPSVIFIDEIDAIGGIRGKGHDGAGQETDRTLNELLVAMDGFDTNTNITVIAATNRSDVLDPALLRRFERKIHVNQPDKNERLEVLQLLSKNLKFEQNIDWTDWAIQTTGCSSAQLKNFLNEAGLIAVKNLHSMITEIDLQDAFNRIFIGMERKSLVLSSEEKELTAYHEAGHAIAAYYYPEADSIRTITIRPRGDALGYVLQQDSDSVYTNLSKLKARLVVCSAGRAAELVKYGKEFSTPGARSDIQQATKIAQAIFRNFGFSDELGPVDYESFGSAWNSGGGSSDNTRFQLEEEVRKCLKWAQNEAIELIKTHEKNWHLLANCLVNVKDTLTGKEVQKLFETQQSDWLLNDIATGADEDVTSELSEVIHGV